VRVAVFALWGWGVVGGGGLEWVGGFFSPGEGGKGLSYRGYSLQMSISGMKEISL